MKKKLPIILTIIILLVLAGIFIFLNLNKVDKFSIATIKDSYSQEISDYKTNKMAFTIEAPEGSKIKVNGKEYKGERLYKVGQYTVTVSNGTKTEKAAIKINEIERSKEHEYNLYVSSETLQALFSDLDLSQDKNQKGYLWTARTSTLNLEKMAKNFQNVQISKYNGSLKIDDFKTTVVDEMREYVKQVLQQDENAYFRLYTIEDRFYLELELFGKIGLDDSRYEMTMYTDGTLGYVRKREMREENSYERFLEEKEDYMKIVENIKSNTGNYNDFTGSYMVDPKSKISTTEYNYDFIPISALRKNIFYELQYPELFDFKDEKVKAEMEKANIEKLDLRAEYNKLSDEGKEIFFENINLNKEELDKNYFTDENANYLVVTGTRPFYDIYKKETFESIMQKVVKDYKDEYTILYKPHPAALPTAEQEKYLNDLGIKVLPGSIPMEAIMFIYPHLYLGGFDSSIYMTLDKGKTKFFFAKDKTELYSPIDVLYEQLFSEAKFYND